MKHTMKHIKLYENFSETEEITFDWLPYEKEEKNPIQSQIPESLSMRELESFAPTVSPEIEKAGLFIAHVPKPGKGFERYIVTSFNPLKFTFSKWNSKFEKESEFDNFDPKEVDMKDLSKGAGILSRFGGLAD